MDYLIGKLPDQTEVQIRMRIRPDSKTYHDQHITFVYNWQTTALIYDKASSMMQYLTSGANVFRRVFVTSGANVFVPNDNVLNANVYVFVIRRKIT